MIRSSSLRRVVAARLLTVTMLASLVSSGSVAAAPCWLPPVTGTVADPFREPPCRWCPGNRGLEYSVGQSAMVRSVAAGTVTYSGQVVGVGYVVIEHADGRRLTYGRLVERFVQRGDRVVARSRLGRASGSFYFGMRIEGRYVDPAPHLGRLVGRPRLVPTDGTPERPAGSRRLRCATREVSR